MYNDYVLIVLLSLLTVQYSISGWGAYQLVPGLEWIYPSSWWLPDTMQPIRKSSVARISLIHNSMVCLRAKFFRRNINMYLHFVSFLHIDATQVVEILPQIKQEPTYSI